MRACISLAVVCSGFALNCAYAQIETELQSGIPVEVFSTARSQVFVVEAGDIVLVRPFGDAKLEIEVSVYTSFHALVAKEDPEETKSRFEWTATAAGSYYVLVRNVSGVPGTFNVALRRGAKAAAPPTPLYAAVRVFYASARERVGDGTAPPYFDDRKVSSGYTVGTAVVTIPRTHQIGELETAAIYRLVNRSDKTEFVVLDSVRPYAQRDAYFAALSEQVRRTSRTEALVFIHGFNVSFEDAARRTAQLSYDLGFGGAGIFFTWPSHYSKVPTEGEYRAAGVNAAACAGALKAFLKDLRTQTDAKTIFLVAHSMGNRLLATALKEIGEEGGSGPRFREVALMAPDIDANVFRSLASAMRLSADRVTLYASSRDEALQVSRRLNQGVRAGQSGSEIVIVPGVDTVDASSVRTDAFTFNHSYFADNLAMLSELYHLLRGDPPEIRFGLERVGSGEAVFWRFRQYTR